MVKVLILMAVCVMAFSNESEAGELYLNLGAGYKLDQPSCDCFNNGKGIAPKDSAIIEFGVKKNNWRMGLSHHSNFSSGAPFNDRKEYFKTEVFVSYDLTLWKW